MISDTYADTLASWFSRKHVIVAHPVQFAYKAFPNCTVVEVSFIPRQNITHLDVGHMFDEEVSSKLVRQVPLSDYSGKHGSTVKGDVSLNSPCEFNKETETPNSDEFSVNLSTDRKTVFVKARDFSPEDSREVLLLFYPDYAIDKHWPPYHLKATYTAYGRELPADSVGQPLSVNFGDGKFIRP